MVYYCENCGFLFQRTEEVWECPRCERTRLRPATAEEIQLLQAQLDEKNPKKTDGN